MPKTAKKNFPKINVGEKKLVEIDNVLI